MRILLVGAGKLGSRHLQALTKANLPLDSIDVVDPSPISVEAARGLLSEVKTEIKHPVDFFTSMDQVEGQKYVVAIVATTAEYRRSVIDELMGLIEIENLILEKFLFQSLKDFDPVGELFGRVGVKVWVNLPRREWDFYQALRAALRNEKIIGFKVAGSKWSIATSAIHFIDLVAYLSGGVDYSIDEVVIDQQLIDAYSVITGPRESKYKEFFGFVSGAFANAVHFNLICEERDIPFVITITLESGSITIFEEYGYAVCSTSLPGLFADRRRVDFDTPYQSDLTNVIVEQIVGTGTCALPHYEESAALHIPLATAYLQSFNRVTGARYDALPIT